MFNKNLEKVEMSKIAAITNSITTEDVIRLEVGDVNLIPSDLIVKKISSCVTGEGIHYTKSQGNGNLIEKLFKYEGNYFSDLLNKNIYITAGGSMGIFLSLQSVLNAGDKVLIFTPTWSHFKEMVNIIGGEPIFFELSEKDNYHISEKLLQSIPTNGIKVLILASPNNPTGTMYSSEELSLLQSWAIKNGIYIIYDQEYEVYSNIGQSPTFRSLENIMISKSFSKSLGISGLRIGYIFGDGEWVEKVKICGLYSAMFSNSLIQKALSDSFDILTVEFERNNQVLKEKANLVVNNLNLECKVPEGGVYIWAKIPYDDTEFCQKLLNRKKVSVVPGTAFGAGGENYIRISLGASKEELLDATLRINELLGELENE